MAEALEEKSNILHKFDSAKIFNTIKQFEKWREEQYQEFCKKQLEESKRFLGVQNQSCKLIEPNANNFSTAEEIPNVAPTVENVSSSSLGNDFNDTLQESSITGHLQRCFDDSSRTNLTLNPNKVPSLPEKIPVFSEIRNLQFLKKYENETKEDLEIKKRPFLKKGTGLLRFTSAGASKIKETRQKILSKLDNPVTGADSNSQQIKKCPFLKKGTGVLKVVPGEVAKMHDTRQKFLSKSDNPVPKNIKLPQKNLKLKPAIRKTNVSPDQVKHIRFNFSPSDHEENDEYIALSTLPPNSNLVENIEVEHSETDECAASSSAVKQNDHSDKAFEEQHNVENETKELAEFEMLENCAQNSSFNSDSSFLQRIIQGDSNKVVSSNDKDFETMKNTKPSEVSGILDCGNIVKRTVPSSSFPVNIGFDNCRKEILARKQELEKVIADMKPKIKSLENEVTGLQKETVMESESREQFITPSEDLNSEEKVQCPPLPESKGCEFADVYIPSTSSFPEDFTTQSHSVENFHRPQGNSESFSEDEEEIDAQVSNDLQVHKRNFDKRSEIAEKLVELQNEIETYQQLNARLSTMVIDRSEIIKKLQKERDDFEKYKEKEKNKLEAEIKEERLQMKRQKESFKRLQKLSKDHPTRKEREELNGLRQEIEKLQEEIKRKNLKYSSESRKWKNRIDLAENERDSLRLENIKLEEQCQDLLAALKPRMKKRSESKYLNDEGDNAMQLCNSAIEKKDVETQTDHMDCSVMKQSYQVTTETSNLNKNIETVPECDQKGLEIPINDIDGIHQSHKSCTPRNDNATVSHGNLQNMTKDYIPSNLSVITVSTDAEYSEIRYGNRIERIHVTGKREIIFDSGTRKLISPDRKSITFHFYNGDVKEIYPDKREVYRYVNGSTETTFLDGIKVIEFTNGQTQHHYPDGKKEIKFPDGSCQVINTDGTETIEYANGQVEIRTSTCKRREFPDGHVRIVFKDGKQETRYPDGRVKMKDKNGKIIFDTKYVPIR